MFVYEYKDLKLTQNPSTGNIEYHSANTVVQNREITSTLDNLSIAATMNHKYVDQLMETIHHLMETNKIYWYINYNLVVLTIISYPMSWIIKCIFNFRIPRERYLCDKIMKTAGNFSDSNNARTQFCIWPIIIMSLIILNMVPSFQYINQNSSIYSPILEL